MSARPRRLQRRLMLAFASFTLFVATVFGFYAIVFLYAIEDAFFNDLVAREVAAQRDAHAARGAFAAPGQPWMTVHADASTFPPDLAGQFAAEPWRTEFAGDDGRHYHLAPIATPGARAWLVAEVGARLFVRPVRNRVLLLLAATGAALVALALVVGWRLARRTSRPLARLADAIDAMSPEALPSGFARGYADDEVGVVARGLDALAGRVGAFVGREQAFTRDASHELRTPLAVIRGAAERLAAEDGLSDAGRRHLAYVRQSVLQLEQTVATLLALAREERTGAAGAPVAVLPVLERAIVEQAPLIDGRDVAVDVDVPRDASVALPAPVLHILLANLVGNAFAHAQAGDVRIDVRDGRLRIVNDGDAGDPAARWQRAQPFDKREGSAGHGVGLSIVRRLCERHGIDLAIDDVDGRVVVSFPVDVPTR